MREAHIYRQLAELHASALERSFLARLGPKLLSELYRAIDRAPSALLLLEVSEGKVLGFIAGGAGMGAILRQMLRRPLALAAATLPLLARPSQIRGLVEVLRHGRGQAQTEAEYELLSIALRPEARGTGLAAQLYLGLAAHCRREGWRSFRIIVGDDLAPAHRFYRKMGAEPMGRIEVHPGQGSTLYRQPL